MCVCFSLHYIVAVQEFNISLVPQIQYHQELHYTTFMHDLTIGIHLLSPSASSSPYLFPTTVMLLKTGKDEPREYSRTVYNNMYSALYLSCKESDIKTSIFPMRLISVTLYQLVHSKYLTIINNS